MPLTSTFTKMGAQVAPDKSYNFASIIKANTWLSETTWEQIGSDIQVITDFIYLGAHLTTRHAASGSTHDKRWETGQAAIAKAKVLPS